MSTSFRKLEIQDWKILDRYSVEERNIYSIHNSVANIPIALEDFWKIFLEKYDVWEIIDTSESIGVFAVQVRKYEENIKVLIIEWIFVLPNKLTVELVQRIIEKSREFHKDQNIDKVELVLTPNLAKEEEKIYDKAGLETGTSIKWIMILEWIAKSILP